MKASEEEDLRMACKRLRTLCINIGKSGRRSIGVLHYFSVYFQLEAVTKMFLFAIVPQCFLVAMTIDAR
jgi:hypothetical protein